MRFVPKTVRGKVTSLAIAAAITPVIVTLVLMGIEQRRIEHKVGLEMKNVAQEMLGHVAADMYAICAAQNQSLADQVRAGVSTARELAASRGGLRFGGAPVEWTAVNQLTKETTSVRLAGATLGSTWLGQVVSRGEAVPLVDEVGRMTGATCTVFQRMNGGGDMLRVATNVINKEGKRGVGTYIPAVGSDGTPNGVIAAVLAGQTFTGRAFVVDRWYMTAYEPIRGANGEVAGMLYCGVPEEKAVLAAREQIVKKAIGHSGYVYVLGGKGEHQGHYVISKDGARDGENIWEAKDASGSLFIQNIIKGALASNQGEMIFQEYPWKNKGEKTSRNKVAAVLYFEPWDWVIGASAYAGEFDAAAVVVSQALKRMLLVTLIFAVVAVTAVILFSANLTNRLVRNPLRGLAGAADRLAAGDIEVEIDDRSNDEIGILARSMKTMADSTRRQAEVARALAAGSLAEADSGDIVRSERDVMGNALRAVCDAVGAMTSETGRLIEAATAGRLDVRGDTARFQGAYAEIVGGINRTLDALVGPLRVAAGHVDRISKGDLPEKITAEYQGEFNAIKDNLNTCIDAVGALIADAQFLSRAAVEGRLATRADAGRHQGDFRAIVEGVNATLDAVIGPLNVAATYVDRISKGDIPERITDTYQGDFNEIKNNLNTCIDAVNALVTDSNLLSQAAVEGQLSARADANRHQGDFRAIVEGVNATLDAVIGPLNVAASYVDRISKGDIPERITTHYNGDFNEIKNNLNTCIEAVRALVKDAEALAQAAVEGHLSTRADASRHQGDFRKIVAGVNATLDAVWAPVADAVGVLERVAARDLTARVHGEYRGDHDRIKRALNGAAGNLEEAMQQVSLAVEQVAGAAGQIGEGSQALAQSASEQASGLEMVSSSLQEVGAMTKANTENSREGLRLAEGARNRASQGLEAMGRLSAAMERIQTSADQTARIVKTIDEIAFQTNLLALNAAVEAARAGDAGKGFAVVAEEVRNLAMRSAEAAKNTANLIEESVRNTEGGVELNREVLGQLQEITEQANKVGQVMGEIVGGSEQQTAGIEQVNLALEQMNQLTQQNAANSEESASAAEELSGQSEELRSLVGQFRVSGQAQSSAARQSGGKGGGWTRADAEPSGGELAEAA